MNVAEIATVLKRDYPLLLLDGVTHIEPGIICCAYKNLSYNEWFFPTHFPDKPIMPGSLQIEAFTQAVALPLLVSKDTDNSAEIPILLVGVDKVRFYQPLVPGDRFDISAKIDRISFGIATASVTGTVSTKIVSECKITYKLIGGF